MSKKFIRKTKESKPVVAICYDFDKTLSPDDMQAQGYIQSVGDEVESFWKESNGLAEENDMDQNLAYMFTMIQKAHGKVIFNKKALMDYGAKVQLFPGVETWFKRIRDYGMERGVIVEHYIISSGLKEKQSRQSTLVLADYMFLWAVCLLREQLSSHVQQMIEHWQV